MSAHKEEQVGQQISQLAAECLAREGASKALITVTHTSLTPDLKQATVFISVLPHTMEEEALLAAKRARSDVREYLREKSRLHPLPVVDFEIDYGEKNRQRVDELTR